jgi:hypothetical protein
MMTPAEMAAACSQTLAEYRRLLGSITPEALAHVPEGEGWSPGQVYSHILMVGNLFALDKAHRARTKEPDPNLGLTEGGQRVLQQNELPAKRFQMPEGVPPPPQPTNAAELAEAIDALEAGIAELVAALEAGADTGGRTKHPFLGFFTATEWLAFIDIHNRHHLRQLNRLLGTA